MIHDDLLFHNCAELVKIPDSDGLRIQRVSETTRLKINEGAQKVSCDGANVELRFVPKDPTQPIKLSLSSKYGASKLYIFWGPFRKCMELNIPATPTTFEIALPKDEPLLKYWDDDGLSLAYHPSVCRVLLSWGIVYYHGVEGEFSPPPSNLLPEKKLLTYGTSITQGANAHVPWTNFAYLTAHRLGADLLNKGMSGSCHLEKELADDMAALDFDYCTLCLSVNMVGLFDVEVFQSRARYLLEIMIEKNPSAKFVCFSPLTYFGDWNGPKEHKDNLPVYRFALESICRDLDAPNLRFTHGNELLTNPGGLCTDLIHPVEFGFMEIAEKLEVLFRD